MAYQLRHPDGGAIAATVELADNRVTLHSRGGASGGRPERNPEYSAAFDAIIDRLRPQSRLISRVLLDSRLARASGVDVVLATSDDFARLPLDEVKRQIRRLVRRLARAYGRAADATPNQGNSTKQLRFEVSLALPELTRRLSPGDTMESVSGHGAEEGAAGTGGPSEGEAAVPPSEDERSWAKGDKRKVAHLRRERASGLAKLKKSEFVDKNGKLVCERCGLIPSEVLGPHGDAVIEVHHERPLAEAESDHHTRLEDLSCLCANCHRVTHREMSSSST